MFCLFFQAEYDKRVQMADNEEESGSGVCMQQNNSLFMIVSKPEEVLILIWVSVTKDAFNCTVT